MDLTGSFLHWQKITIRKLVIQMKYKSQKVAYWFFGLCMLLFTLQIVYGFIMGFARIGMDGLHDIIPFNTARAVHTNLLVGLAINRLHGRRLLHHS